MAVVLLCVLNIAMVVVVMLCVLSVSVRCDAFDAVC